MFKNYYERQFSISFRKFYNEIVQVKIFLVFILFHVIFLYNLKVLVLQTLLEIFIKKKRKVF